MVKLITSDSLWNFFICLYLSYPCASDIQRHLHGRSKKNSQQSWRDDHDSNFELYCQPFQDWMMVRRKIQKEKDVEMRGWKGNGKVWRFWEIPSNVGATDSVDGSRDANTTTSLARSGSSVGRCWVKIASSSLIDFSSRPGPYFSSVKMYHGVPSENK